MFTQKSNFMFSLCGEAVAITKAVPNLGRRYGTKNSLITSSQTDRLLEITATSLRAPAGSFLRIKGETKGPGSWIIFPAEV